MINRFEIEATIEKQIEFKLTPTGQAILVILLKHQSEQIENQQTRIVNLNIMAKLIGKQALMFKDKLSIKIHASGFLKTPKLGYKNVVFHIDEIHEI